MFAPATKRKSKSRERSSDKEKIRHDRIGSARRIEVTEKIVLRHESETDKKGKPQTKTQIEISDDNFNTKLTNPLSRDISIEGQIPLDTQIEQGIMNLLEQEMARVDKKQYPPRPQSLSFYEDEFTADDTDLSGQLQTLSPAEKQAAHRTKKSHNKTINANDTNDDFTRRPQSDSHRNSYDKSPKHDHTLGNSREKIVHDQRKSKKQRRGKETTAGGGGGGASSSGGGKKSRRRNQSFFNEGYQPKTDITMALEDLQDDVFDTPAPIHGYNYGESPKSPQYGGISPPVDIPTKIYIDHGIFGTQLKAHHHDLHDSKGSNVGYLERSFSESSTNIIPLDVAIIIQRIWMPFSTFCHGLLAGVALMHLMMLYVFKPIKNDEFVWACIELDEYYKILFFVLCVICIVSVFDRYDLAHLDLKHLADLWTYRKSCLVIPVYLITLGCFLAEVNNAGHYRVIDDDTVQIIKHDFSVLIYPVWSTMGTVIGWFILACSKYDDLLGIHLDNMSKYGDEMKKSSVVK